MKIVDEVLLAVMDPRNHAQAATFLIDQDRKIKLAYRGKRTKKNFKQLDNSISKT